MRCFGCLCPASTVSTEYSTGRLYSVGSGSPSEDWGKMVLPLQKQVFRFSVLQLAVVLYTLTQPLIAKIYTPDSAIYSLRSQQQVYMPYMTACGAFNPPTHYSIHWDVHIYIYYIYICTRMPTAHCDAHTCTQERIRMVTRVRVCNSNRSP